MSWARHVVALVLAGSGVVGMSCNDEKPALAPTHQGPATPAAPEVPKPQADAPKAERRELLVLAASSLTDAFKELERAHEKQHPEVDVLLSFAGSSALTAQVDQGGVGDVLATASEEQMKALAAGGNVKDTATFAYNQLVVAVPEGNPAKLKSFEDLAKAKRIVLGAPNVPVGKYADELLERSAGTLGTKFRDSVIAHVVSREANVRLVLSKIELGEADAVIVYSTDIMQPGCKEMHEPGALPCERAHPIEIPDALSDRATYPIALLSHAIEPALGRAFVDFVLSDEGQAVLTAHGFISARATAAVPEPVR